MKFKIVKHRGSEALNTHTETVLEVGLLQYLAEDLENFICMIIGLFFTWAALFGIVCATTYFIYKVKIYF